MRPAAESPRATARTPRRLVSFASASLLALSALSAACGGARRAPAPAGTPAEVVFTNNSLNQAEVFAVTRSGARARIGTVFAGRTETLRIPAGSLGADHTASIVARIRATGRAPSTGLITVAPGERVQVTLPNDERMLVTLPMREP